MAKNRAEVRPTAKAMGTAAAIVVVVLYTPTYLQKVPHIPAAIALEAISGV